MGELFEFLTSGKQPLRILVILRKETRNKSVSRTEVTRKLKTSYSWTIKLLDKFEEFNIIRIDKSKRAHQIVFTQQGERLATLAEMLLSSCLKLEDLVDNKIEKNIFIGG